MLRFLELVELLRLIGVKELDLLGLELLCFRACVRVIRSVAHLGVAQ